VALFTALALGVQEQHHRSAGASAVFRGELAYFLHVIGRDSQRALDLEASERFTRTSAPRWRE
jgi:hypothetical protein